MRKARYYYEANFYHIMVQGDEKKYIFKTNDCKSKYLKYLRGNASKNDIEVVAYCVMDNHVHVLLFCEELAKISKCMQQTNTSFALYYNNKRKKVGHVFRERFHSESIYTKYHLVNCIKYIHQNPVKADICEKAKDYSFSNYKDFRYLKEKIVKICDFNEEDIKFILSDSSTITQFLDDEYSKKEVSNVFNKIVMNNSAIIDKNKKTSKIYKEMKGNCKITDEELAKLMGITRITLYNRLKKCGVK